MCSFDTARSATASRCGDWRERWGKRVPTYASPYLYIAMAARCRSTCAVAESDGRLLGLAILQPPLGRQHAARLIQLCVDPAVDELATGAALLAFLLARGPFRQAATIELGDDCPTRFRTILGGLAAMPLAKRPTPINACSGAG
jgi:Acetyltransferase (GNAT) family